MLVVNDWFQHLGQPDEMIANGADYRTVNSALGRYFGVADKDMIEEIGLSHTTFFSLFESLGGIHDRVVGLLIAYHENKDHEVILGVPHRNIYSVGMKKKIGILSGIRPDRVWDARTVNEELISHARFNTNLCEVLGVATKTYYLWDIKCRSKCYTPFLKQYFEGWNLDRVVGYAIAYGVSVGDLQIGQDNKIVDLYQSKRAGV